MNGIDDIKENNDEEKNSGILDSSNVSLKTGSWEKTIENEMMRNDGDQSLISKKPVGKNAASQTSRNSY